MKRNPQQLVETQQQTIDHLWKKIGELERKIDALEALPRAMGGGPRNFAGLQGTIGNAQTPNTLLLSGIRAMTGNLDMGNHDITLGTTTDTRQIRYNYRTGFKTGYLAQMVAWNFLTSDYADFVSNLCRANTFMAVAGHMVLKPIVGMTIALTSYTDALLCAELLDSTKEFRIPRAGDITMLADKCLAFTTSTDLTIGAGGDITIQGNNTRIDTNGGAATDNLDSINGGTDGQIIVLRAANDAHTVVCRDGVGNLSLTGGVDFSLDSDCDTITLMWDGTAGLWLELCRADNA